MYYRSVSTPEPPTYHPPKVRMHPRQALAILLEQGLPESEALRRIKSQSPPQDEGEESRF